MTAIRYKEYIACTGVDEIVKKACKTVSDLFSYLEFISPVALRVKRNRHVCQCKISTVEKLHSPVLSLGIQTG